MSGAFGTPLGLVAIGSGVVLMFSAYRNVSPIALVTNTLTGQSNATPPKLGAPSAQAPSSSPSSGLGGGGTAGGGGGGGGGGSWGGPAGGAQGVDHNDRAAMTAWIHAHLGQWPDPGAGANDFWNALAKMAADTAHVTMQGAPS